MRSGAIFLDEELGVVLIAFSARLPVPIVPPFHEPFGAGLAIKGDIQLNESSCRAQCTEVLFHPAGTDSVNALLHMAIGSYFLAVIVLEQNT